MLHTIGAILKSEKHLNLAKWDRHTVSQVIKHKQDNQFLKRQRDADKKRVEDLEKRLDEFEKGKSKEMQELHKRNEKNESKLQEALRTI